MYTKKIIRSIALVFAITMMCSLGVGYASAKEVSKSNVKYNQAPTYRVLLTKKCSWERLKLHNIQSRLKVT